MGWGEGGYNWVTLLSNRDLHNIVNHLYFIFKKKNPHLKDASQQNI